MRFGWLVCGLGLLAVGLFGCGKKSAPGMPDQVLLRLKAKPGDQFQIRTVMQTSMTAPGDGKGGGPIKASMKVDMTQLHRCLEERDGATTWEVKTGPVETSGTGPMEAQAVEVKRTQNGKVAKMKRDDRNLIQGDGEESPLEMSFPEQAVQIGDQWRGETRVQGVTTLLLYTVEDFEKIEGRTAVRVKVQIEGNPNMQLKDSASLWVDAETGWPIKGNAVLVMEPQPGVHVEIDVQLSSKR